MASKAPPVADTSTGLVYYLTYNKRITAASQNISSKVLDHKKSLRQNKPWPRQGGSTDVIRKSVNWLNIESLLMSQTLLSWELSWMCSLHLTRWWMIMWVEFSQGKIHSQRFMLFSRNKRVYNTQMHSETILVSMRLDYLRRMKLTWTWCHQSLY